MNCDRNCSETAMKLLRLMIVSFYKIASNNFTKLLNGLDKQKKLIMKEVKKLMKETKTKQRIKKEIS